MGVRDIIDISGIDMVETTAAIERVEDPTWLDARRVEAWAGELRVNLIRLIAIVVFYGRHLIEFFLAAADSPVRGRYHLRVTAVVIAWAAMAVVLHVLLS